MPKYSVKIGQLLGLLFLLPAASAGDPWVSNLETIVVGIAFAIIWPIGLALVTALACLLIELHWRLLGQMQYSFLAHLDRSKYGVDSRYGATSSLPATFFFFTGPGLNLLAHVLILIWFSDTNWQEAVAKWYWFVPFSSLICILFYKSINRPRREHSPRENA